MQFEFKNQLDLEKRKEQSHKIMSEYSDKIPVVLERAKNCKINKIIKTKYILSKESNVCEFISVIRKKLELEPGKALFFLANGKFTLSGNEDMGQIYKKYKDDEDDFLYLAYSEEEVFG